MRNVFKLFLALSVLAVVLSLTACSFVSTFVVANESNDRIQIRYVVKKGNNPEYPRSLPLIPGVMLISELDDGDRQWRNLSSPMLTYNETNRTAVITLMPNEAVRIEQVGETLCEDIDKHYDRFEIEEISITGASGTLRLTGEQVTKSFTARSKQLCVLTYR
ncbi:MAG TPA: hypothetical protein VFS76_08825 [Pyrinomonadaceae bacterium]|nr:hypothetical protein [Pyrinomonadaceae bacterium]